MSAGTRNGGAAAAVGERRAGCPSCGYDLTGTVNSWKDSCPLRGTCSECGGAVEWSRVFAAAKAPAWSCEHSPRFRVGKLLGTAWKLLRPRAYWRAFTPAMPVRTGRLAWMVVAFALSTYVAMVAYIVALGVLGAWLRETPPGRPTAWARLLEFIRYDAIWSPTLVRMGGLSGNPSEGWDVLAAFVAMLLLAFPIHAYTRKCAKEKPTLPHVWRAVTMLIMGCLALHLARYLLIVTGGFAAVMASQGAGMGYGMVVGPIACSTVASAALIVLYGTTMWAAYILVFHKVTRGHPAVIFAWLLMCLGVLVYWLYPIVAWFLRR